MAIGVAGLAAFRLDDAGGAAGPGARFEVLVEGHLSPFAALCAERAGLSPRLIWSNAAFILDWALGELASTATVPAARAEAEALLAGRGGACRLAHPLRTVANGTRTRRMCCLRYKLAGIADCGALCPRKCRLDEA